MTPEPKSNKEHNNHLGVAILAAGQSTRMGKQKLLLPWCNSTILGHLITLYRTLPTSQITAVYTRGNSAVRNELERNAIPSPNWIENPKISPEMYSSVLCAIRWKGWSNRITHIAIVLGDQPQIRKATIFQLTQFSRKNPESICQPQYKEKRCHPVILPLSTARSMASRNFIHLKEALEAYKHLILPFPSQDSGLINDIDTPKDYLEQRTLHGMSKQNGQETEIHGEHCSRDSKGPC
ncbi:MAG: Molybdenum cofactor cytidylyltransferase [Candidatus Moanabacter tarae]|uniref:Molybdenum cofactor cytidylyltransferase n=1 Tax=Candidatus Moanibacter tarae TaxID=2200854 RepID=A0A2Z4AD40_9BACT|nr:MAG: Molybdenum cofactor cytidylyltransferase [Candidatus Moanabacter tarae]|tara:strand:- start:11042 stop:11752 length:711 start_codon:yes stop_codon:yes gene_type:complete